MKKLLVLLPFLMILLSCVEKKGIGINVHGFYKPAENPILKADSSFTFTDPFKKQVVKWQRADVFNPAAIVKDNKVYLLYRCEDNPAAILGGRTSRLGLAESEDGIHFKKFPEPVLYPDSSEFMQYDFPGGCEDPRLVQTEEGVYVVTYTAWNYKIPRLSVAFSNDLYHWQKKGPAFAKAHVPVGEYVVDGPAGQIQMPIYPATDPMAGMVMDERASMPVEFIRDVQRSGYEVERQRRWAIGEQAGNSVIVPIEELQIRPISGKSFH